MADARNAEPNTLAGNRCPYRPPPLSCPVFPLALKASVEADPELAAELRSNSHGIRSSRVTGKSGRGHRLHAACSAARKGVRQETPARTSRENLRKLRTPTHRLPLPLLRRGLGHPKSNCVMGKSGAPARTASMSIVRPKPTHCAACCGSPNSPAYLRLRHTTSVPPLKGAASASAGDFLGCEQPLPNCSCPNSGTFKPRVFSNQADTIPR